VPSLGQSMSLGIDNKGRIRIPVKAVREAGMKVGQKVLVIGAGNDYFYVVSPSKIKETMALSKNSEWQPLTVQNEGSIRLNPTKVRKLVSPSFDTDEFSTVEYDKGGKVLLIK
jgi:bifunctional DNA-binding transcriptional regulator/antitoxin component of YhaV-PrlF toxin-antitoxin module